MLAKKLNYGDTVGVVGVLGSIDEKAKQNFYTAEKLLQKRGFRVKRGRYAIVCLADRLFNLGYFTPYD